MHHHAVLPMVRPYVLEYVRTYTYVMCTNGSIVDGYLGTAGYQLVCYPRHTSNNVIIMVPDGINTSMVGTMVAYQLVPWYSTYSSTWCNGNRVRVIN
jgi:hypothetical protein